MNISQKNDIFHDKERVKEKIKVNNSILKQHSLKLKKDIEEIDVHDNLVVNSTVIK